MPPRFLAQDVSQSLPDSAGLPDGRANPCRHGVEGTQGSDSSSTDPILARDHGMGSQQHWEGVLKNEHIPKSSNGHEVGLVTHCTAPEMQALEKLCSHCLGGHRQDAALLLQRFLWGCWCWGETRPSRLWTPQMC